MSDRTLSDTGRCLCGAVSYACEVETTSVMICHCAECQVMGSTAYRIGAFLVGDQLSLSGEVREYGREACIGARSNVFCPTCATVLYSHTPGSSEPKIVLSVGTLDQRDSILPKFQVNCDQALGWRIGSANYRLSRPRNWRARAEANAGRMGAKRKASRSENEREAFFFQRCLLF